MKVIETRPPAVRMFLIELDEGELNRLLNFLGRLNGAHLKSILDDRSDCLTPGTDSTDRLLADLYRRGRAAVTACASLHSAATQPTATDKPDT